jgi:hypothetical protein
MAAKVTRLTHKIAIQLHLVAESCTEHFWPPVFAHSVCDVFPAPITSSIMFYCITNLKSLKYYNRPVSFLPNFVTSICKGFARLRVFTAVEIHLRLEL